MCEMKIENKKDILFIVNPISGAGKQKLVEKEVAAYLNQHKFNYQFIYTERAHHAYDIAKDAVLAGIDIVAIVGGDGSVNETAKALVNTTTRMAIIPTGSGNGLARELGITCDVKKAILQINTAEDFLMDTGLIGDHFFVGAAGFGFDAELQEDSDVHRVDSGVDLGARYPQHQLDLHIDGQVVLLGVHLEAALQLHCREHAGALEQLAHGLAL